VVDSNDTQRPEHEPILREPSPYEIREELERLVVADLLGPAGGPEEEVDEDRVRERYLVGFLAPRQSLPEEGGAARPGARLTDEEARDVDDIDAFDELGQAGTDSHDEGTTDQSVSRSGRMFPSSIGMTFSVAGETRALRITARWGRYVREHSETAKDKEGNPLLIWKRTPVEGVSEPIRLEEGKIARWEPSEEHPNVYVKGKLRRSNDEWLVTLFLVNGQEEPALRKDEATLFQVELAVESVDGEAVFVKRMSGGTDPRKLDPVTREENESMAMVYRRYVEFAVGHGGSVHVEGVSEDGQSASRICTRAIPRYEVPQQDFPTAEDNEDLQGLVLDMKELSEVPDGQFGATIGLLCAAYKNWIEKERARMADPKSLLSKHEKAAKRAIARCEETLKRIQTGIDLLDANPMAATAFRFANQAMRQQRVHSIFARQVRRQERKVEDGYADIDEAKNRSWRPFQLAFLLLNLPSCTNLHHPDRSDKTKAIADLLWFPTGGGKTEAYLGLAAYVMALRRLEGEREGRSGEHGVAVLMRYTLRLLTLQQFQRATALICAAELIRQSDIGRWGEAPFRIGLWVGMGATPNTTKQALEATAAKRGSQPMSGSGSPLQLTSCPWCGTTISSGKDLFVYAGMDKINRTLVYCGDDLGRCPFSQRQSPDEGIPALVVDEEIYRHPPTLLIATVDKFAQMPWKGAVQMLFGQVNGICPRHGFRSPEIEDSMSHPRRGNLPAVKSRPHAPLRPPDLIIQDELHLISGPLGSMVGLYETAVDELCSWEVDGTKVRPKVIASTATIRRASVQVHKLFLRKVNVFPPHGLDINDNFFSLQREPHPANPGRRYLGICGVGRRYPVVLIRVYVALLAAAKRLYDQYDAAVDPWMTLVGYFNSIRELGGTRRLVEDDIRTRLRDADIRGLAKRRPPILEELTSRRSGVDIPKILDRLEVGFSHADDRYREDMRKRGLVVDKPDPLDVVLATNMISVGVDIDRLSLMAVAGQPKTTAEYIQATSRVGRNHPGLVCTVFNWARPRDLSHYERFEHYHSTFYQQVEALSVTPFAPRALDRGLSGVLVALIRLMSEELNANLGASNLKVNDPLFQEALAAIVERVALAEGSNEAGEHVRKMLSERNDEWRSRIQKATTNQLGYREQRDGVTVGLLSHPDKEQWDLFTCLNSLTDVEPTVNLILADDYGLDSNTASPAPSGTV